MNGSQATSTNPSLNIVVGGGIIGLLTAWYLLDADQPVLLVERNFTGRESSWAAGGILSPLYPDRYPALAPLVLWSRRTYGTLVPELKRLTGIDPELVFTDLLVFGEQAGAWGTIESTGLVSLEPALKPPTHYLTRYGEYQVRNPRLLSALRQGLLKKGVRIIEEREVIGFEVSSGRFVGVVTRSGVISGGRCVVATGAWTGELLRSVDLHLPIQPVRGQMILFSPPRGLISRIVVYDYKYLVPRLDGKILVGSTIEEAGFDKSTTLAAREELQEVAYELVPSLKAYPVQYHWAGLRPGSPDDAPFIGEHPNIEGLFVCSGHYRNGFAIGPATARLVVDLMLAREPVVDPHPYRLSRLSS